MITVFTPVYNRKYIIEKLYESLQKQSCYDFEWLIIDDGSTDNLQELIAKWQKQEKKFSIRYHYVRNGGKHRAINIGVEMAKGDAFFVVDSDDFLALDAIEFVKKKFEEIADDDNFAGIAGLKSLYTNNIVVGGNPKFDCFVDATSLERAQYGLIGDKAEIYKTAIWQNFMFPKYEGENFLAEGVVHNAIAGSGRKIRWFNKVLYYCEYRSDGLSKNIFEKRRENPLGWAANIKSNIKYLCKDDSSIFKERYLFYECMHQKYSMQEMCQVLEITKNEYVFLKNRWIQTLELLDNILKIQCASTLALYGMGMNAKRLMLYLNELGVKVYYGMDQNYEGISFQPVYGMDMELPFVDSVCITIKNWTLEVKEKIQKKLPAAYVWILVEEDNIFL